jgi:putative ABC transport system permease protein
MEVRRAPPLSAGHAGRWAPRLRLPAPLLGPHAGVALLLVLEVALACLLALWAWQAFAAWRDRLHAGSGVDEARVLVVTPLGHGRVGAEVIGATRALLAGIDGVEQVASVNQVPYGRSSWNTALRRSGSTDAPVAVSTSFGDPALFEALGLHVVEGRALDAADFEPAARLWQQPGEMPVVITRALALRLFDTQAVVGRHLQGPTRRMRVVGVVSGLPIPAGSGALDVAPDNHMILPAVPDEAGYAHYLVRAAAGRETAVARAIRAALAQRYPDRPILLPPRLSELRPDTLQGERRMAWTLAACALAAWLLTLLSLGATGMLWVQRNAIRISLHRALGASCAQVRRSVRWDQARVVMAGCVLGLLAATLLARLPWSWPMQAQPPGIVEALGLLALALASSQLVATWPARRAATVAPHHVTRKPWVRL